MINIRGRPEAAMCLFCDAYLVDGRITSGYKGLGTDWMSLDGDFGCALNPITSYEEGTGPHWSAYDATMLYLAAEIFGLIFRLPVNKEER